MNYWQEILQAPLDHDLSLFRRFLDESGIPSYVFERNGMQSLCVPDSTDAAVLRRVLGQWEAGDVNVDLLRQTREALPAGPTLFDRWWNFPLTLCLVAAAAITYGMVATPWGEALGGWAWFTQLTLQSVQSEGDSIRVLAGLPGPGEAWRYWSPLLLHFSALHILFNGMMTLELGRRIESVQGSVRLLLVVMVTGLLSNLAQYFAEPGALFGGLSGALYGLIGYLGGYQRVNPQLPLRMPPGLLGVAVFWLLLCMSGLVTLAGLGRVANAAHVGGLAAGVVTGVILAWLDRSGFTSRAPS